MAEKWVSGTRPTLNFFLEYNKIMNEQEICYLCGHNEFEKLDGIVRDNPDLDILKCKNCSLVFLSSFEHICENFYENDGMFGGTFGGSQKLKKWLKETKDDDSRRFNMLKKEIKGKKVLDFGCGNGGFLTRAKKIVQRAVGIELQKSVGDFHNQNGLEVHQNVDKVEEKFDYITLFHVLEHLKDPIELLQTIGKKLTSEGQMIIEVPNANDALISLYKNPWFMRFTYWSCHLYLFDEQTLLEVAKKAGFKVNYLKKVQRYGLANHIWWQFAKKPGGHKKLWFLNCKILNKLYEKSIATLNATDTLIISVSKK